MTDKSFQALLLFHEKSPLHQMNELNRSDYMHSIVLCDDAHQGMIASEQKYPVIMVDIVKTSDRLQEGFLDTYKNHSFKNSILIVLYDENDLTKPNEELLELSTISLHHPVSEAGLIKIVEDCLSKFQENLSAPLSDANLINSIKTKDKGEFTFQRLEEAQSLSTALSNLCPNTPEVAIGLLELMINGIEHGNLAISFDEKGVLLEQGKWHQEIDYRLSLPEYSSKKAQIQYQCTPEKIEFVISDEGDGFDPGLYLPGTPLIPPANAHHKFHGRGIKLASQLCFDHLKYLGKGNQVKATIDLRYD